jgi:AraC-like DNA-binding protein
VDFVATREEFRSAKGSRVLLGHCWCLWRWDSALCGSVVWGRPGADDVRTLLELYRLQLSLAPRSDVVTDASRIAGFAPDVFALLADSLRELLPGMARRIRKHAIVPPAGLVGAAIAGLYPLLRSGPDWIPAADLTEAFTWLDTGPARAALPAVERLISGLAGRSATMHRLHDYLRRRLKEANVNGAALALGMSRRALQRALAAERTRFRDQLNRVRIEEARRGLLEDKKLERLALELGYSSASHFASAYLAATGETPSDFRARHRI